MDYKYKQISGRILATKEMLKTKLTLNDESFYKGVLYSLEQTLEMYDNEHTPTSIVWMSRYSDTMDFDDRDRWARIPYFKDLRIGWMNGIKTKDDVFYSVNTNFPINSSDLGTGTYSSENPQECIEWLETTWGDFLKKV